MSIGKRLRGLLIIYIILLSFSISFRLNAQPSSPYLYSATNITADGFTVTWSTVSNANLYVLLVSPSSSFETYTSYSTSATSYVVSSLNAGTLYYYKVQAINSSSGASPYSSVLSAMVAMNLSQNYVRSVDVLVSGITSQAQIESATINQRSTTYSFFDGLARPIQQVLVKSSPSQQDIVQPITYDAFGREAIRYLPYVSGNDGRYKDNFLPVKHPNYATSANAQYQFYQNTPKVAIDGKPYAETRIEPSPLNRILEQGAYGTAWQPDANDSYSSSDRTVKKAYETNLANEVLLWTYVYPTNAYPHGLVNAGTAAAPVYYAANQLYKNRTKDEEHHEVIEYFDQEERLILTRVQVSTNNNASTTDANKDTNWASTYYVYDDFGNLVCVIPPEASKVLSTE